MSLTPPKPVPCKGCGKPIIFEKQPDGKWLVSEFDVDEGVRLEKHNCPSYKPKPKEPQQQQSSWTGTNKSGQFIQARVNQDLEKSTTEMYAHLMEKLTSIHEEMKSLNNNVIQTLVKLSQKEENEEPKREFGEKGENEMAHSAAHDGSDYGF